MLPAWVVFLVATALAMLAYSRFPTQFPGTNSTKPIFLFLCVFVLVQITMHYFRRTVRRLSAAHQLMCPSCGRALGFSYSTLQKTGKCRFCGEPFPGAV